MKKTGKASEIGAKFDTAAISKNPKAALSIKSGFIKISHTGRGL